MKNTRRKEPTEEQKAAAAQRREQIKGLMAAVKAIPTEKRILLAQAYGIRNPEGRELSPYNQCLLIMQNPHATVCGGFGQWKKLDRHVMKGAKALAIWVPIAGRKGEANSPDCTAIVPYGTEPTDGETRSSSFMLGNVFDIAQTESTAEREARQAAEALTLEDGKPALAECAASTEELQLALA